MSTGVLCGVFATRLCAMTVGPSRHSPEEIAP
jgi:hypothetical protein